LGQFETSGIFRQQFEVAEKLANLQDASVLKRLQLYLNDHDRHVRGHAAYIFAALGDDRGFEVIRFLRSTGLELHPLKSSTFHGALLRQIKTLRLGFGFLAGIIDCLF
jgi:hypothetical protein